MDRSLEVLQGEPMIFFLGAGASRPAPAQLPQPPLIQRTAFECVAPAHAVADKDLIERSLPEIYHEVLLDLGGEGTRQIWKILSAWESPSSPLHRFSLGPNVVHLLVVYLSWKAGVPVITVNFDQMLERAAERLGLHAEPVIGQPTTADTVAIWKLHGSVDRVASIRTTMQGITATDPVALEKIESEFGAARGCLIGYSGQDIDFFPFLCRWVEARPIYWLSLDLAETAIERSPAPFLGIDRPAQDWARDVIRKLPPGDEKVRILQRELNRPLSPAGEVDTAYETVVRKAAKRIYAQAFPPNHPRRLLGHAMALAALGENRGAERWLETYMRHAGDPDLDCRAHLLASALAHEFARYEDSERHARLALDLARAQGMSARADEAILRIDEARRMLFVPPRLPVAKQRAMLDRRAMATIISMLLHAWRLRRRRRPSKGASIPSYAELRATFGYLEHLVRVGAIPQGMAERFLPGRTATRLFAPWWSYVERSSYRSGYTFGIGNAKKYRLRRAPLEARVEDEFSALDLYELAPSPTGASIHHRDVADVAAGLMRRASGIERDRRRKEAIEHYELAIDRATEAGDPSLELKAMFGLQSVEPQRRWPRRQVAGLVDRIQSPAYTTLKDRIVTRLAA